MLYGGMQNETASVRKGEMMKAVADVSVFRSFISPVRFLFSKKVD